MSPELAWRCWESCQQWRKVSWSLLYHPGCEEASLQKHHCQLCDCEKIIIYNHMATSFQSSYYYKHNICSHELRLSRSSPAPRYTIKFETYLDCDDTNAHSLIPNLTGLTFIYCLILQKWPLYKTMILSTILTHWYLYYSCEMQVNSSNNHRTLQILLYPGSSARGRQELLTRWMQLTIASKRAQVTHPLIIW